MEKKVNILISTYNGEKYLEKQMSSLFHQSYKNIKIYVRDDGSTDGTMSLLKKWEKENKIILLTGENLGFCGSFYTLLKEADEGEYWAFCDQDDIWKKDKIEKSVEWLKKQNDSIPLLYHSSYQLMGEDGEKLGVHMPPKFEYDFRRIITENVYSGFAMVINGKLREMLLQLDYNKVVFHDWMAGLITMAFGKIYFSPYVAAKHRIHKNNASATSILKKIPMGLELLSNKNYYKNNVQQLEKNFYDQFGTEEKKVLEMFHGETYSLRMGLKKSFYPKRWNSSLPVELILRIMMLTGKV